MKMVYFFSIVSSLLHSVDPLPAPRWVLSKEIKGDFHSIKYSVCPFNCCVSSCVIMQAGPLYRFCPVSKPGIWYHPRENNTYTEYHFKSTSHVLVDKETQFQLKDIQIFKEAIENHHKKARLISRDGKHLIFYFPRSSCLNLDVVYHYTKSSQNHYDLSESNQDQSCSIL